MPPSTLTETDLADASESIAAARRIVGEAVGDLMGFWNFKPSMGRVWSALYLSPRPLTAAEIVEETGLSVGSVSMTIQDLRVWGVVRESGRSAGKRCYVAETDVVKMTTRVFREREMALVGRAMERFEAAVRVLEAGATAATQLEGRFVATRTKRLLALSKAGHTMMDRFVRIGRLDFGGIRDKLARRF